MGPQQLLCLFALPFADGLENRRVFGVGGVDARPLGEVQAADDADLFADFPVDTGHLAVAGGFHQVAVKVLVQSRHLEAVVQRWLHYPGATEPLQCFGLLLGGARAVAPHCLQFEDDAQLVQFLEMLEVEGLHLPAAAKAHLQVAFALQAVQRLAHRGAAGVHAQGDVALAEAIAGQQAELADIGLELGVDEPGEAVRVLPAPVAGAGELHRVSVPGWR
ncbi:hypothetical protein D9M69_550700 [compost metagenome]